MIDHIQAAIRQLAQVEELKVAVGRNLTQEQQLDISKILAQHPGQFVRWVNTDNGRTALREFVDKFVSG